MATLEVFCNESWGWRNISNQIWLIGKEKCARALYCFGDGQICPRRQSYLYTQIIRVQALRDKVPTSFVTAQKSEEETTTRYLNMFPRKQLKLYRKYQKEEESGRGQEGQALRHCTAEQRTDPGLSLAANL